MLDTDTKRRIDTARDILVGKVPDPKSQVEQITIALIYKFMDDMDAESEELGGKRKFFTGDFARYGWAKLLRSGLSGHETLALYAEAVSKMPENPGLPELFRDIFKNAYLPYRDPETLKAFLKIIDEFTYDHSEKLGDAFEYLLSVLGSQGDAGQFRTPRHIIDFMVEIVGPKKDDKILDPACGTAGLLVSAYKYIKLQNSSASQRQQAEALKAQKTPEDRIHTSSLNGASGDLLTPDDRAALARNIQGYDISPDMVRLSLVNLYLHGFNDPHIYEYDTLTSEERWNEFADVILANPPFMSPKGGIKPHQRFSIQSKRSEVLFVDYMADHLTPGGRAAIIVPEGIIFQSQNAYKDLRRKLIDECLVAVVSLPAGCFNPYSGVKTSILIFDKSLAKHSPTLGFFKVENDGFGLGAQRRPIDKNDLPQVKRELQAYLETLRAREATEELEFRHGLIVEKARVTEGGECNLSGERYRDSVEKQTNFPIVALETVAQIAAGNSAPQGAEYFQDGDVNFIRTSDVGSVHLCPHFVGSVDKVNALARDSLNLKIFPKGTILFPKSGASTFLNHRVLMGGEACVSSHLACIIPDEEKIIPLFLYRLLTVVDARLITPDQAYPSLRLKEIGLIKIPLPPLPVQKEIVAEIEGYQKVIDGARAVLDHYRPHIPIHPDWPMVALGEVCQGILTGPFGSALHQSDYTEQGIPVINPANIKNGTIDSKGIKRVSSATRDRLSEFTVKANDIIIARRGEMGRCGIIDQSMNGWLCGTGCFVIRLAKKYDTRFAFFQISSPKVKECLEAQAIGVTMKNLNQGILSSVQIPLPPLETQQAIVAEIEAEQALVKANRELIQRMEKKIEATLARVWGEAPEAVVPEIDGESGELLAAEDPAAFNSK